MSDLFAVAHAERLARLEALGWKKIQRYGRDYWESPETRAWHSEAQALAWLDKRERPGKAPD